MSDYWPLEELFSEQPLGEPVWLFNIPGFGSEGGKLTLSGGDMYLSLTDNAMRVHELIVLMADFDKDGDVDGDDFLIWQQFFGGLGGSSTGDADGDGDVDGDDFLAWQAEFGAGLGGGSVRPIAVPEPKTLIILGVGGLICFACAGRSKPGSRLLAELVGVRRDLRYTAMPNK